MNHTRMHSATTWWYRAESAAYLYTFVLLSLGIVAGAMVWRAVGGER